MGEGGGLGRGEGGRGAQEGGCVGSWVRYTYPGWRPLGLTPLSTVPSLTGPAETSGTCAYLGRLSSVGNEGGRCHWDFPPSLWQNC